MADKEEMRFWYQVGTEEFRGKEEEGVRVVQTWLDENEEADKDALGALSASSSR